MVCIGYVNSFLRFTAMNVQIIKYDARLPITAAIWGFAFMAPGGQEI